MLHRAFFFSGLLLAITISSAAHAQKVGDRRIVDDRQMGIRVCQVYGPVPIDFKGGTTIKWSNMPNRLPSEFVGDCAKAINLKQYLDSRPVVTEDGLDYIITVITEKRGWIGGGRSGFTHACGNDGLLYDVFKDATVALHQQTLQNPDRRCRINPNPRRYNGGVASVIGSVGGEVPAKNPKPYRPGGLQVAVTPSSAMVPISVMSEEFNRTDGPVGNGWASMLEGTGEDLVIRDGALSTPGGGNDAHSGIYRTLKPSSVNSVSLAISDFSGYNGIRNRFDTSVVFGSGGTIGRGFSIQFYRGDQSYENSSILFSMDGRNFASIVSEFQFDKQIFVKLDISSNGVITGLINDATNRFSFTFEDPGKSENLFNDIALVQGFPDSRSSNMTFPRIDYFKLSQNGALVASADVTGSRQYMLHNLFGLDTFTRSSLPQNSWGTESFVTVGGWGDTYHGFLRFDITDLPQLEPNQRVVLKLYNKARTSGNSLPAPMRVQRLETAVSNETSWASRILTYTANQKDYKAIQYDGWVSIDLTEHYRAWKAGSFNHGIALIPLATDNNFNFFVSTENTDEPLLRPFLEFY